MRAFQSVTRIIDSKSIVISALSVLSTWLCMHFGITADFPLTLIATAIVFPLVFSIGTAYKRREKALEEYGNIKAHGRALYLAGRDWLPPDGGGRTTQIREILGDLLLACRDLLAHPIEQMPEYEPRVHAAFSRLSLFVERMRKEGLVPNECSRCNQYVSRIMISFENLKHIYQYRTPRSLRAFSDFFILILPILYGPYFALQAGQDSVTLFYLMPILFTVTLVGLANIQDHLENPFDQIGGDDVTIHAEKFVASLQDEPA